MCLAKVRRFDPNAHDYGTYILRNDKGVAVLSSKTLADVEKFLNKKTARRS